MNQMPMNQPNNPQMNPIGQMPPQGIPPMGNPQQFPGAQQPFPPMQQGMPQNGGFPGQQMPGQPPQNGKKKAKKNGGKAKSGSNAGWVFLGIFLMIGLSVLGGVIGYNSAVKARKDEYNRQAKDASTSQYVLALSDVDSGKLENARIRLEYILSVDPEYTKAQELYQQVLKDLQTIAEATAYVTDTPMPTATMDVRDQEAMFAGIQQAMAQQDWNSAIEQMETLKDKDITYRPLEIDSMYYIAQLKYGNQQINAGNLESGIYRFTVAEAYGPIDYASNSMRNSARSYLSGEGFWEINWEKCVEYYRNAAETFPNLRDNASGWTAGERYALASFNLADQYIAAGDYCTAVEYFTQGVAMTVNYSEWNAKATEAYEICYPAAPEPAPQADTGTVDEVTGDYLPEDQGWDDFIDDEGWIE